jgi:RNA polymerase sigma factor (sigma-70 family)
MQSGSPRRALSFEGYEDDEVLIRKCLTGDEKAWTSLTRKYANLIFSIPIRRGFSQDDAADVFQAVCLTLLNSLASLREPKALPAWLIQTTAHTCDSVESRRRRVVELESVKVGMPRAAESAQGAIEQLENEQLLREAVVQLGSDCKRLIELLFFNDLPVPYEKAAAELGLATGSIGATRMRCLEKLRTLLEKKGFR